MTFSNYTRHRILEKQQMMEALAATGIASSVRYEVLNEQFVYNLCNKGARVV